MTQQTQVLKKGRSRKSSSAKNDVSRVAKKGDVSTDSTGERQRRIEEAAYFIAEKRGFHGDLAISDWLEAEASVDAQSVD